MAPLEFIKLSGMKGIPSLAKTDDWDNLDKNMTGALLDKTLYREKMILQEMKRNYVFSQIREAEDAKQKLRTLKTYYDKIRSKLHQTSSNLKKLEANFSTIGNASNNDDFYMRARQLIAQIEEKDALVVNSQDQKEVYLSMTARLINDGEKLNKTLDEMAAKKIYLKEKIHGKLYETMQLKKDLKSQEVLIKKIIDKICKRNDLQKDKELDIAKINNFREYQLVKKEDRNSYRKKVLRKVLGRLEVDEINAVRSTCIARKLYNNLLDNRLAREEEKLAALESSYQQLRNVSGCSDVDDIAKKFLNRQETNQHLRWMIDEMRSTAEGLKRSNEELEILLKKIRSEITTGGKGHTELYGMLAFENLRKTADSANISQSIRSSGSLESQLTQEVPNSSKNCSHPNWDTYHLVEELHLKSVMKDSDDSKAKSKRLFMLLEELRVALTRYLSKIEQRKVPAPSNEELSEYVLKLNNRLTEMMASVSQVVGDTLASRRAKEPKETIEARGMREKSITAESALSRQDKEQALPYAVFNGPMVLDLLFKKLMTTALDTTPENLRVLRKDNPDDVVKKMKVNPAFRSAERNNRDQNETGSNSEGEEDIFGTVIDRVTLKKLSNMITSARKRK